MMTAWILLIYMYDYGNYMAAIDANSKFECERIAHEIIKSHPGVEFQCINRNLK